MKITGGSFGSGGQASVNNFYINIRGAFETDYPLDRIQDAEMHSESKRHVGIVGMVIGILLFGWLGFVLAGPLGLLAGIVLSIAGSFYSTTAYSTTIRFDDGKSLVVTGPFRDMNQLIVEANNV